MSKKVKVIVGVVVSLVVLISLIAIMIKVGANIKKSKSNTGENSRVELETKGTISKDTEETISKIREAINKVYENNAYIVSHIGEEETDVMYLIYNSNKECYYESGENGVAVYRNDGKAVVFTDPVKVIYEIDNLRYVTNILDLVEKGYASVETGEAPAEGISNYVVKVLGKGNIKKVYSTVSNEYADEIMNELFGENYDAEKYKDVDYNNEADTDCIKLNINIGNNGELGISSEMEIAGVNYLNWWFDGYLSLGSWELGSDWYKEIEGEEEEVKEKYVDMITDVQQNKINSIIQSYENAEGIDNTDIDSAGYSEEDKAIIEESNKLKEESKKEADEKAESESSISKGAGDSSKDEEYLNSLREKEENGEMLNDEEYVDLYGVYSEKVE